MRCHWTHRHGPHLWTPLVADPDDDHVLHLFGEQVECPGFPAPPRRDGRGTEMSETCAHCHAPIRTTNYALGPEVEHYEPDASFPSLHKGTAWRYCRLTVATAPPPLPPRTTKGER